MKGKSWNANCLLVLLRMTKLKAKTHKLSPKKSFSSKWLAPFAAATPMNAKILTTTAMMLGVSLGACTVGDEIGDEEGNAFLEASHPTCASASSDPDGDGWGWENNASCIVQSGGDKSSDGSSGSSVWFVDFQNSPNGFYDYNDVRRDWGKPKYQVLKRANIRSQNGNKFVRINYPRGGVGPSNSGAMWGTPLKNGQKVDELYMSYRIRFSNNFDWRLGGKLPGLGGGEGVTGGREPNGYNGWSSRLMWREAGSAMNYVYHVDQPAKWGEDFHWSRDFQDNRWVEVEQRVKMNSPGQKNGIIQSWINGRKVQDRRNVRFRHTSNLKIDHVQFETFFGGSGSQWAPNKDVYIDFDDITFSKYPITH